MVRSEAGSWVLSGRQIKRALCCVGLSVSAVWSVPARLGSAWLGPSTVDQRRASVESRDIAVDDVPCADRHRQIDRRL